ncbi:MAG: glycosyltransferase family 4 protein [Acidobacteriota bacterium]|nr:glycosyltransferase family 4 protein [Acidobacteriota bacterium]
MTLARDRGRSLMLAPLVPEPTGNGLAMRAATSLEALARLGDVTLVVVPAADPEAARRDAGWARERCERLVLMALPSGREAAAAWLASPTGRRIAAAAGSLPSLARGVPPVLGSRLAAELGRGFERIFTLRLYLSGVALGWRDAEAAGAPQLVLDLDEDDAATLSAIARLEAARGVGDRARKTREEAEAFGRLAGAALPNFDRLLASTVLEAQGLAAATGGREIVVVPNAVRRPGNGDSPGRPPASSAGSAAPRLLLVGNYSYLPNVDAAERLVRGILPRLRESRSEAEAHLVGGGGGSVLEALAREDGAVVHGWVDDLRPHYGAAAVVVVPLRAGGGSRLKILEAAAHGVPVVATPVAARGLEGLRDGREIRLAESDDELALAVRTVLDDPAAAAAVAERARDRVLAAHAADRVAADLATLLETPSTGRR